MSCQFVLRCSSATFFWFPLTSPKCSLGRSPRCTVVVNHSSISRQHAEFRASESGFTLYDLDSLNGTFVNGQKIRQHPIQKGQIIRFGSLSFTVSIEEVAQSSPETEDETDQLGENSRKITLPASPEFERLSEAERRVFELMLTGGTERRIAGQLNLSTHTVHNHCRAIFRIFDVHSKVELFSKLLK